MKLKDLAPNKKNPRKITPAKLEQLKKALTEFGDLSGVVYNRKTKQLVGGHQRVELFKESGASISIQKEYNKPTRTGTTAEGSVMLDGERFSYREVSWDKHKEMAANIAANKGAGQWDKDLLAEWLKELGNFDLDVDLDLTMFDEKELKAFDVVTVSEHTRAPGKESEDETDREREDKPPKCRHGEVYLLGTTRLRCGRDELYFCDQIITRWEKYSGASAILQTETPKAKKPVTQATHRADLRG